MYGPVTITLICGMVFGLGVTGVSGVSGSGAAEQISTTLTPATGISIGIGITVASSALFFGVRAGQLMERLKQCESHFVTLAQLSKEHAMELAACKSDHRRMIQELNTRLVVLESTKQQNQST